MRREVRGNTISPSDVSPVGTDVIDHAFGEAVAERNVFRPRHDASIGAWRMNEWRACKDPAAEGFPSRDDRAG